MSKEQIVRKLCIIGKKKIEEILQHNQEQFKSVSEKEITRDLIQEVLRTLFQDLNLEINAPSRNSSLLPLGFDILKFYSSSENQSQKLPQNLFLKNLATAARSASEMETNLPIGQKIFEEFTQNLANYIILDHATFSALNCKEYFEKCQEAKKSANQGINPKLSEVMSQSNLLLTLEKFYSFQSISPDFDAVETSKNRLIQPSKSRANIRLDQMAEEIITSARDIPGRNPQASAFRELKSKQSTIGGK